MKKPLISYNTFHDLYVFIFCLNLFGMLFFGIYPSARSILRKRQFLKEIDEKNNQFALMLSAVEEKENYFREIKPYLPALNKAIPDKVYGDKLIEEMLFLTSSHAFSLNDLSISNRDDNTTDFSVSLEGDFERIDELLDSLENTDLSLKVNSVKINFSDRIIGGDQNIDISIRMYNLNEEKRTLEDA